jgi:TRAP-type C4-dicarboxylate transport system substrate-binding protein
MLRINWVPIVGATVMRRATFEAMSPESRAALRAAADQATEKLRAHRARQDEESIEAMKARGMTVKPLTPELEKTWRAVAEASWPQVRGTMVPAETFDKVRAILAAYREGRQ